MKLSSVVVVLAVACAAGMWSATATPSNAAQASGADSSSPGGQHTGGHNDKTKKNCGSCNNTTPPPK
jgi:hypothetical protein